MTDFATLKEHAAQTIDAFGEAVGHLEAGRSLTGTALSDPESDVWTRTQIKALTRFARDQKLKLSWGFFNTATITDPLTNTQVDAMYHSMLFPALASLFCERSVTLAIGPKVEDEIDWDAIRDDWDKLVA